MPAKKKNTKTDDINKTLKCQRKGEVLEKTRNYYKVPHFKGANALYQDNGGYYPICRGCIREMCYDKNNNFVLDKFKEILQMMNRPFIQELFDKALIDKRDTIGAYLSLVSMNAYKQMTWEEGVTEEKGVKKSSPNDNDFLITQELLDKWGEGYQPEEYRAFEKKWVKLIDNYGEKTSFHTENLITYIRLRVKEELATAKGDSKEAKEWGALADKAAQNAKINVSQLSKSDLSGGVDLICQIFEAAETEVGIIPLLPRLLEQPYDDADMIIWANINYGRRLEDKPRVSYRDIWNFYDEMLEEYFAQQGFNGEQIQEFKKRRNNVFRDLGQVYKEPVYEEKE